MTDRVSGTFLLRLLGAIAGAAPAFFAFLILPNPDSICSEGCVLTPGMIIEHYLKFGSIVLGYISYLGAFVLPPSGNRALRYFLVSGLLVGLASVSWWGISFFSVTTFSLSSGHMLFLGAFLFLIAGGFSLTLKHWNPRVSSRPQLLTDK